MSMKQSTRHVAPKGEKQQKKRGFDWLLLAAAAVVLYFSSLLVSQQVYLNQIGREQESADKRLTTAQTINAELKKERDELNDLSRIEKVAREELGMTKEGELPYSSGKK